MTQSKEFTTTDSEILEFNKKLHNYIITSSELNKFDDKVSIFEDYDIKLKNILSSFKQCISSKIEKPEMCVNILKNDFESLRSKMSIRIESEKTI